MLLPWRVFNRERRKCRRWKAAPVLTGDGKRHWRYWSTFTLRTWILYQRVRVEIMWSEAMESTLGLPPGSFFTSWDTLCWWLQKGGVPCFSPVSSGWRRVGGMEETICDSPVAPGLVVLSLWQIIKIRIGNYLPIITEETFAGEHCPQQGGTVNKRGGKLLKLWIPWRFD